MNKMKTKIILLLFVSLWTACDKDKFVIPEEQDDTQLALTIQVKELSQEQLEIQAYVKARPIIAHRGTTDYAPENTAAAYRFARQVGSDYLLVDLQMSKDGVLVGFRNDLNNHANISELFPGYENAGVNHYTLEELKSMDVGSSFVSTTYDRPGFEGLQILTLEEIINICEGKLPDGSPDPADNGNRPGIYIRLYEPWLNPGLEEKLKTELIRLGWYVGEPENLKTITTYPDKVDVANTNGRVFLATMEKMSLLKIEEVFQGKLPLAFWLWQSDNYMPQDDAVTYADFVNFGIDHGAQFIAPNTSTSDLLEPWQATLIRRTGARIQGYTIDTKAEMAKYTYNTLLPADGNIYQFNYDLTDGFITNRPQYAAFFYGRYYLPVENRITPEPPYYNTEAIQNVFAELGY